MKFSIAESLFLTTALENQTRKEVKRLNNLLIENPKRKPLFPAEYIKSTSEGIIRKIKVLTVKR